MKRIIGGICLLAFVVLSVVPVIGGVPETGLPTIKRYSGATPASYGYLNTHSWANGTDTAWVCDTSEAIAIGAARRASVTYMTALYDEVGGPKSVDSVSYRLVYEWSNDLSHWFPTDSTGAKTDTLYHNDTLIIRPFEYMQIISRVSRPSLSVWDTTGLGGTLNPWQITAYRVQAFYFPEEAR
jgi:hypothetical protein